MSKAAAAIRMIPMLAVMGIIFTLSHQSGDQLDLPQIPFLDKIGHFALYGLLSLTVLFVPSRDLRQKRPKEVAAAAVLLCLLFGISDEFHQSFIPGRYASLTDIAADVSGSVAVCLLWLGHRMIRRKR